MCAVLENVVYCAKQNLIYNGARNSKTIRASRLIAPGSEDEQLVADSMEDGFGIRQTTARVNALRTARGDMHVGCSCVYATYMKLQPDIKPIKAIKQGSNDPTSPWAKARLGLVVQLLIRLGELEPEVTIFDQKMVTL